MPKEAYVVSQKRPMICVKRGQSLASEACVVVFTSCVHRIPKETHSLCLKGPIYCAK